MPKDSLSGTKKKPVSLTPPPAPPESAKPLPPTPASDGAPITDVNTLPVVTSVVAAKIKKAAGLGAVPPLSSTILAMSAAPQVDSPGSERWPVKTGQDPDRAKVGKNVINRVNLKPGIVEATLEELISLPRPPGLQNASGDPLAFGNVRDGVTEVTIWRIEVQIMALKHEKDGDYHLVLQGKSGQEMVGEIPTPTTVFVGDSPWIANIGQARSEVDNKLVKHLSPASFALLGGKYVPSGAVANEPHAMADPALSFVTPPAGSALIQPLFQTAITPTSARITGVGFFDRAHGATGAAPNVIELHPILKIEWL
jgi:hypothetical protein